VPRLERSGWPVSRLLDKQGLTLVETMISVAMAGGVALAIGSLIERSHVEYKWAATTSGFNDLKSQAIVALKDRASCSARLRPADKGGDKDAVFSKTTFTSTGLAPIPAELYAQTFPGLVPLVPVDKKAHEGTIYDTSLNITSISNFLPPLGVSTKRRTIYSANLRVKATREAGPHRGIGGDVLSFQIPLELEMDEDLKLLGCGVVSPAQDRLMIQNPTQNNSRTVEDCKAVRGIPVEIPEGMICKVVYWDTVDPKYPIPTKGVDIPIVPDPPLTDCPLGWTQYAPKHIAYTETAGGLDGVFGPTPKSPPYTGIGCY